MLEIEDALARVLAHAQPLPPLRLPAEQALGCVLAEAVVSDVDSPPHDKSIVDGYAVRAADALGAPLELTLLEEITAGGVPTRTVEPGTCSRIMTGAPVPAGATAVVMVEQTELLSPDRVRVEPLAVKAGQNIMRRASSLARGQTVLAVGTSLRAIELGLLHEVGRPTVLVRPRPRVAVLATGNELVPADQMPGAGQIRNSNGPMLAGLARQSGAEPLDLGIGRDEPAALRALCQRGLECDLLTVAGGVSAGVLDLVPSVLEALHVRCVFHRINLKPGKPLWFGVATHADTGRSTLVFGLPGNPVSSLVCFELFVRPVIARLAGRGEHAPALMPAQLDGDFHYRGGRVTMHPAALRRHGTTYLATPLNWRGSGDLRTLTEAQGLIRFAGEPRQYLAGDEVEVFLL